MNNKLGEQFIMRPRSMLESKTYRSLSLSARRFIERIELEQLRHGGKDNGKLPVTYQDFSEYGLRRSSVIRARNEAIRKGFVRITRKGRSGKNGIATEFRLTFLPADNRPPTNDWKRHESIQYRNVTDKSTESLLISSKVQQNKGHETVGKPSTESLPLSRETSSEAPQGAEGQRSSYSTEPDTDAASVSTGTTSLH